MHRARGCRHIQDPDPVADLTDTGNWSGADHQGADAIRHRMARLFRLLPDPSWAISFLVIALVAAALGFGGAAGTAIAVAQLIFVVAILAFLASAVFGLARRPH